MDTFFPGVDKLIFFMKHLLQVGAFRSIESVLALCGMHKSEADETHWKVVKFGMVMEICALLEM